MKIVLTLLSVLLLSATGFSQNGIYELMERNDISITDAQRIAQRHFDTAGTGKGTGYKQFQRWLYERKFHTDENGYYISTKTDWEKYQQSLNSLTTANVTEAGNWTELGPWGWNRTSGWNPGTGRLSALAVNPSNQNNIYAGSPGGGIWKTINGGATWNPLTDNNNTWMSIFALAIDPFNTNRVYAGTSGNAGIIISTDAGATWSSAGGGPSGTVRKILIHPSSTNIVFAACTNGVWRSTNNGTTWTLVHSGAKEDIEFKPDNPDIMFATGSDVYRSTDNGLTWINIGTSQGITNTGRTLVAVSPANPNYVYVCQASGGVFGRMYKSTDGGLTFITTVVGNSSAGTNYFGYDTNGTGTTGQATYDMGMDVSPTNASEVYIAGIICWKSTNEATSFTAITAWSLPNGVGYNHADVHGLFWVGNILYSISDGGVYKSTDNGDNWTDITTGMGIRQFYRIANSQTNATVITGGAQDNGSVVRQASTGNWADWLGADGMEGLVSPTNHLNIWGTSQNGALYRSTNGGNSYSGLGQPSSGQWVTPLAIHPTNETILYGGWTGVYKSTNSGSSWTNLSSGVITVTLADLAIAPSDPNYIYASTGNTLFVTTNEGATWTTRAAPATINDITVDPTDPSKIWIALNSTTNRVMVSVNAGATFTNVSANLPSITARTITVDDNTPRNIYVGMNIGVYHKTESDANWTNFSDNLPLVAINELEIQKATGKIRVATYGRGVWESPLSVPNSFDFTSPAAVISSCPAPTSIIATLGTIQNGTFSTPIVLTAAGNPPGTTVSFTPATVSPGSSTTVTLNGTNTLNAGNYTITVTGTAGSVVRTRNIVFTISTGTGPSITGQPIAQTVCVGSNATFSVTTTTGTYQWQVSTDGGSSWTNTGGATSSSLTLTAVTVGMNNNQYRCIVTGQCGTTPSTAALLTVNTAATISAQPTDAIICAGQQNTFCVAVTGTNLTYQWQTAPVCSGSWTNVTGGINSCLTVTGVTFAAYRCIVTASGGCSGTITSNCVTLTVVSSVAISTQPVSQIVCEGQATNFTAAGSGSGLTYQWQLSTNGGTNWSNISGATNPTYNTGATTFAMSGHQYRCIISNGICATPSTTNAAVLTVNTLPAINANPQSTTLCVGANNTFSISTTGTAITYQWQLSTDGGGTYTNIGSANSSTYSVTAATISMNNNRYRCIVSGACTPAAVSTSAVLTVIAPVTINTHPSNTELCSGNNTTLTVAGNSATTIIYQWQLSTDGGNSWNNINNTNNASLTLNTVTAIMDGNRYRCLLSNTTCTTPAISNAAILIIRATPIIGISASPITALLPGQTTILTSTPSTSTGGSISTIWMYNSNPLTVTGNTYTVNVEHTGAYQIRIQESWAGGLICNDQSPVINITAAASERLFIFPSPNDGRFTVSYYNNNGSNTRHTVAVFDSKGAMIYNASFAITGPYTLLNVNIQPAQKGIYHIVVGDVNGKKLITGKVVIH